MGAARLLKLLSLLGVELTLSKPSPVPSPGEPANPGQTNSDPGQPSW